MSARAGTVSMISVLSMPRRYTDVIPGCMPEVARMTLNDASPGGSGHSAPSPRAPPPVKLHAN
jgi:hypothetical protein